MRLAPFILLVTTLHCGGEAPPSEPPRTEVRGTVAGRSLAVADSIFISQELLNGGHAYALVLSDKPGACEALKAQRDVPGATLLVFKLVRAQQEGAGVRTVDVVPGTYPARRVEPTTPVSPGNEANGELFALDEQCRVAASGESTAGSVTLEALAMAAEGASHGTFDVTFGEAGERLEGTFHATFCDTQKDPLGRALTCGASP